MEQHSPEPASVSSYARYWLNRWAEETSPPGGAVRIALYTSNPASDGQSSVAADARGGRWHNSSIAVEWADEIHVRNEEVATRYRESLQMVSDHWIDTGLLPAAQSETADDPDPQRRQRAPRRIKPKGNPMTTQPEIHEVATWFTAPGWSRAHELEVAAIQGCDTVWTTWCGKPYPYLEYPDTPTQAPDAMPRCRNCLRSPGRRR
jgi:hypothetical protein